MDLVQLNRRSGTMRCKVWGTRCGECVSARPDSGQRQLLSNPIAIGGDASLYGFVIIGAQLLTKPSANDCLAYICSSSRDKNAHLLYFFLFLKKSSVSCPMTTGYEKISSPVLVLAAGVSFSALVTPLEISKL